MATLKQFEANRRNAQKSTGPKTPEGKAAVCMNALRHGLRARTVVLPGEDREEFNHLCDDLEVEWHPQSRTEQFYVEQMAVSQWKLIRMEVSEVNIFKDADGAKTQLSLLDRLWQAECRLERSYSRAQRELQRLQNSRPDPFQQPEDPTPAPAGGSLVYCRCWRRRSKRLRSCRVDPSSRNPKSDIRNPRSSDIQNPRSSA